MAKKKSESLQPFDFSDDTMMELLPERIKSLPVRHRLFLLALMDGQKVADCAKFAGYEYTTNPITGKRQKRSISELQKLGSYVKLSLEGRGLVREWLSAFGLDDLSLATKMKGLLDCGNKNVELSTLQLAMRLKGHLGDQDERPAATEIHLHVMSPDAARPEIAAQPILDVSKLTDKSAS